jgi:alpha-ketoglutarate-dependent taurine dioxygenase
VHEQPLDTLKYSGQSLWRRISVKTLPSDSDCLRLHVKEVADMSDAHVKHLIELLRIYGAAILVPERESAAFSAYKTLDRLFGTHVPHDRTNKHGVVEINPAAPTSINVADTEHAHLPHTDDGYTEQPSRFMTLQCRVAAPSGGGASTLVSGHELLAELTAAELDVLMKPGMLTMGRRPAVEGAPWAALSSIPMFWKDSGSERLQLRWRCIDGCVKEIAPEAREAIERLDTIARDEARQMSVRLAPKEILVVDNRAHAHGRTAYTEGEPRIMWRKNYMGDGELATRLDSGICEL